jgi:hypothetical protein
VNLNGVTADSRKKIEAADLALQRPWDSAAVATAYHPKAEDARWIPIEQVAGYRRLSWLEVVRFRLGLVAYAITAWIDPESYAEPSDA